MAVNFEEYLQSKRIDSAAFRAAESSLWESWKLEFEQVSPSGFTAQKLFLINPLRRKYQSKEEYKKPTVAKPAVTEVKSAPIPESPNVINETAPTGENKPAEKKPVVPRPVFKPKPKPSEQ